MPTSASMPQETTRHHRSSLSLQTGGRQPATAQTRRAKEWSSCASCTTQVRATDAPSSGTALLMCAQIASVALTQQPNGIAGGQPKWSRKEEVPPRVGFERGEQKL